MVGRMVEDGSDPLFAFENSCPGQRILSLRAAPIPFRYRSEADPISLHRFGEKNFTYIHQTVNRDLSRVYAMVFICAACPQRWHKALIALPVSRPLSVTPLTGSRRSYSSSRDRPPRVGIIGSGPAGFYAARRLQQKVDGVKIDMYEMLPTPYGLVRFGVAPDHPEVKVTIGAS